MGPTVSVAIPAHNEERFIASCIESVRDSAHLAETPTEVVVALNRCTDRTREVAEGLGARCVIEDTKCIASVRNAAVRATTGPYVITVDADSRIKPGTVASVVRKLDTGRFIGGGSAISPERLSLGILLSLAVVAPHVLRRRISAGMFWFKRSAFDELAGFDESLYSAEDLDFAVRLKRHGKSQGLLFGTLWRDGIITSCRKFDRFGDWYLFRNPKLVRALIQGRSREAADNFYYDVDRN